MKKFYSTLAIAALACATAAAVNPASKHEVRFMDPATGEELVATPGARENNGMMKAGQSSPTSRADILGMYLLDRRNGFNSSDTGQTSVEIVAGEGADDILIYGLIPDSYAVLPLNAKVSFSGESPTITIPQQNLFEFENADGSPAGVYCGIYPVDQSGKTGTVASNFVLELWPQCTITNTQTGDVVKQFDNPLWVPQPLNRFLLVTSDASSATQLRGYAGYYQTFILPMETYAEETQTLFNKNEYNWVEVGTASFEDGWMHYFSETMGFTNPYNLKLYRNAADSYDFLLANPYGEGTPYASFNANGEEGYIRVNVQDPECVMIVPGVYSGVNLACMPTGVGKLYMANAAGVSHYLDGNSLEIVKEDAEFYGDELSTMTGNVANIVKCQVANNANVFTYDGWYNSDDMPIQMSAKITFPEGVIGGVEGIVMDSENSVKTYYNLQGVQIANPAAGEIVIVKEGSKTSKIVVR
ncbi:MAG: hypothetical protein NC204_00845 [Candidatus Amulumruptor caecigallinarius]|nr:hypothetical protein [Candidatus Amulumruptor caecigallinarius]